MIEDPPGDPVDGHLRRRRASDRARERAGRAAYLGDHAGLLIATGTAEALMSSRMADDRVASPSGGGRAEDATEPTA